MLLLIWITPSFAQTDTVKPEATKAVTYANNFLVAGLMGKHEEGNTFSFTTNHGVRYGRLFSGLGVGYDSYRDWNVLQAYAFGSIDVARIRTNAIYLFMSGGYSTAMYTPELIGTPSFEIKGGGNFNTMLGYRIKANQYSIYFATGYKFQRINYQYDNYYYWFRGGDMRTGNTEVQMDMNRFVIQIGFGWH